jgi:hypothetical protein
MRRMQRPTRWIALLVLAAFLGGCGVAVRPVAHKRAPTAPSPSRSAAEDKRSLPHSSKGMGPHTSRPTPTPQAEPSIPEAPAGSASATVDPQCVFPGGTMTLTVRAGKPNAAVVYIAYYSNGKNGAKPPYGDGLGGNDGGNADTSGMYTSHWVVSAQAPAGPAHVHVSVLYPTRPPQRADVDVPFTVGKFPAGC